METVHLFDLVFKKLITSSPRGVIHLINGLFNTDFSPDSPVEYLSTEHISEGLTLRRSDTMIKINNSHTYNLEAQTQKGREMVVRVFEYGFMQARDTQTTTRGKIRLAFPMPKIIYLDARGKIPDMITLELKFPDNSIHEYKVGTFKIQDHAPEELFQQKMMLLLPFYILKLRHKVKRAKTGEELKLLAAELKNQIEDLTLLTKESGHTGILEKKDINTIQSLMERLFRELYTGYTELEGVDTMLVDEIKTYAEELEEKHAIEIKTYAEELEEKHAAEIKTYTEELEEKHAIEIKTYTEELEEKHAIEIKTYAEELEEKHAIEIKTYAEELEEKHAIEIKTYAEELEEKYTKKTEELAKKAEQERQNKLDLVRNLKTLDVPIDKIVKASGLPLEVVEKL